MHWWPPNPQLQARKGKWSTSHFHARSPHLHMAILPSLYLSTGDNWSQSIWKRTRKKAERIREWLPSLSDQKSTRVAEAGRNLLNSASDGQRDRDGGSLFSVGPRQTVKGSSVEDQSTKTWRESFSLCKTLLNRDLDHVTAQVGLWSILWGFRNESRSFQKSAKGRESHILQK